VIAAFPVAVVFDFMSPLRAGRMVSGAVGQHSSMKPAGRAGKAYYRTAGEAGLRRPVCAAPPDLAATRMGGLRLLTRCRGFLQDPTAVMARPRQSRCTKQLSPAERNFEQSCSAACRSVSKIPIRCQIGMPFSCVVGSTVTSAPLSRAECLFSS
jgi:hypothetical protein